MIKNFYVMSWGFNDKKVDKYDVMPYLIQQYKNKKKSERPKTFDEFREFITGESVRMWWSRCQYEIIVEQWPPDPKRDGQKIDVHFQLMMNIDTVTKILMENVGCV